MNKLDIAYNYVQACRTQQTYEESLNKTLQLLCPDNYVVALADTLHGPYQELLIEVLGEEAFDWIQYWQYEADYGTAAMDFIINDVEYNTQDMSLYKFLEITCGFTK